MLSSRGVVFSFCRRCASLFAPERLLSEANIKNTIDKMKSMRPIKMKSVEPTRKAAVLIPLCVVDGRLSLLYTLRTPHLSTHKGQVSFPGGRQDEGEHLEDTALRETEEELGISHKNIKIWGAGNLMAARDTYILPVLGEIMTDIDVNHPNVNRLEVEEVFTVPVEVLCDTKRNGYTQFKNRYSMPVYLGGKRKIWGITAVITHIFLNAFLPIGIYKSPVKYIPPLFKEKHKEMQ